MSGSQDGYTVTQLENHGVFHLDVHMFMQDYFYQAEPDVMAMVMTQVNSRSEILHTLPLIVK